MIEPYPVWKLWLWALTIGLFDAIVLTAVWRYGA